MDRGDTTTHPPRRRCVVISQERARRKPSVGNGTQMTQLRRAGRSRGVHAVRVAEIDETAKGHVGQIFGSMRLLRTLVI